LCSLPDSQKFSRVRRDPASRTIGIGHITRSSTDAVRPMLPGDQGNPDVVATVWPDHKELQFRTHGIILSSGLSIQNF
jgi:hypothetical protein